MALVNGGYLHFTDLKKFFSGPPPKKKKKKKKKNRNVPWMTLWKNYLQIFLSINKHGSGEWGLLAWPSCSCFPRNIFKRRFPRVIKSGHCVEKCQVLESVLSNR